jgi:hypothetical protein
MRFCAGSDPDLNCRDRFRWEISQNRLAWYVNGVLYMEHTDFEPNRQLPSALLNSDLYVYFGSFLFHPDASVVRFHWDRIAINTASAPAPTPSPAASPNPTASPTAATASEEDQTIVSFDEKAGQDQPMDGQFPAELIDWGTKQWYHAGPYGAFTSKSISFVQGRTRASFGFLTPRRLIRLDAYNGGSSSSTITLTCDGQSEMQAALAAKEKTTLETNWADACTTVTVTSSNGWDTNFDNLVIDE